MSYRLCCLFLLLVVGCDVSQFTANSAADVYARATPGIEEHWDYEFVGEALPAQIMQIEGLLRVSPENESLHLQASRAYASYSFGWVEDEAERLALAGDAEAAALELARAIRLYRRAMRVGHRYFELDSGEFQAARQRGLPGFRDWLTDTFDDPSDAPALWWVGYAWGLYINVSHPTEAHPERAFAIAMVRRSVALDPEYYGASGLAFLAYVATRRPGAEMDQAQVAWDRALEVSGRRNLLALVTMARVYAVLGGDRELFVALLREVLEAGDVSGSLRLSNKVARRRAQRYLGQVDEFFQTAG